MTVCNRDQPPATGWEATSKADSDGKTYYRLAEEKKAIRPAQTRYWYYPARDGSPLVRVRRIDNGKDNSKRDIKQQRWDKDKQNWIMKLDGIIRADIPIYRYADIQKAIVEGKIIYIVEGEPCADLLWSMGLAATCNIGGGGKWQASDTEDLKGAAIIVICPDRDKKGIEHAERIAKDFPGALWLYPYPKSPAWDNLPKSQGLDIADWITSRNLTEKDLMENLSQRRAAIQSLQKSFEQEAVGDNHPAKSRNKRLMNLLEAQYGERLTLNEMSQQVELDGEDCKLDVMYIKVADELDTDISKDAAADFTLALATKNAYSPVRRYLESLADCEPINLDELAQKYLGTSDPLHAILFKKTLIAAVARTFKPGCKHDTLCIFQGDQGFLKSTFWQVLTGEPWFTDNLSDANEKDEKLKLRRYWVLEYAEFETAYKRKEVEQLKAFLSSRIDSLRKPYGRAIEDFSRTSIFVGTTNREEFLQDPTGERRYWVIPVKQKIPVTLLETERDRIWGEAVRCYQAGESWWLSAEEDAQLAEANQGWQSSDPWEAEITHYTENRNECTVTDLLDKAIGLELHQIGKREQMRVSDILRRSGWKKAEKQKRVNGKNQWYWEKVRGGDRGGDKVVTEVVTPLNPYPERAVDILSPPVTTFLLNNQNEFSTTLRKNESKENKCGESFENIGGDTQSEDSKILSQQSFEGVTTSLSPPMMNPAQQAKFAIEARMGIEVQNLREALASGDKEQVIEIYTYVQSESPQERGFFLKQLTQQEKQAMQAVINGGSIPTPIPPTTPQTPANTGTNHKEFAIGDRVVIVDRGLHHEQKGKVIDTQWGSSEADYAIQLDKESHLNKVVTITVPHRSGFPVLMKL
ncbi:MULTISPECIES: VapE domain-containing protein [unclassified Microcoleus]|uniref:VapE domain-containing protein n=1 Tax=unclassified Microcoleus TaxID=2642155 RepID=UPI002FD56E9E